MKITSHISTITCSSVFSTCKGGIQKEAYMLGVPCVTMRENTEWVETVEDDWNVLVGADYGEIVDAIRELEGAGEGSDVFGSGDASESVLHIMNTQLKNICNRWSKWH